MKMVFYSDALEYGGAEKCLEDIIEYFYHKGYEICFICANPAIFKKISIIKGVILVKNRIRDVLDLKNVFQLKKILTDLQPDILFFNFSVPSSCQYGVLIGTLILSTKKIVGMVHSVVRMKSKFPLLGFIRSKIASFLLNKLVKLICASKASRQTLINNYSICEDKVYYNYLGIDTPLVNQEEATKIREKHSLKNKKVIGVVSRLVRDKGHIDLINAFMIIEKAYPDTVLMIVGDGPQRLLLENKVKQVGRTDKVIFTGFKNNIYDYITSFDISVLPSLHESFPYVVIEAMALGKPVVATKVGGIPEAIDSSCGVLVPPNNPALLAEAIIQLLKDNEYSDALAKRAGERAAERFSKQKMMDNLNDLLQLKISGLKQ
jgi:glycosyltransferase involved in cell wall biosynthesis